MKKTSKIFVLDTNVLLHDYKCIYNFEENHIVIPIVVLEELDRFKRGNDLINFHAREFTRELDKLSGDRLLADGISLGKGKGKLFIETGKSFSELVSSSFPEATPDHRILAIADFVRHKHPNTQVVLITKDINLRMKYWWAKGGVPSLNLSTGTPSGLLYNAEISSPLTLSRVMISLYRSSIFATLSFS